MKSLRDIRVQHKTVFLRVDFNVPFTDDGKIASDARIKAALPTIEYLIEQHAKIILASHAGRPKGKVDPRYSLRVVAERLSELLGQEVYFVNACVGPTVEREKEVLKDCDVLLLENLRFHPEEEDNDLFFAQALAENIDIYVNDAFGAIHRAHASIAALPSIIFDKAYGFLIESEIRALDTIKNNPAEPSVLVMGGVKMGDKANVVQYLAPAASAVLIGGGLANAFLQASGVNIQASVVDAAAVASAHELLQLFAVAHHESRDVAATHPGKIVIPIDVVVASSIASVESQVIDLETQTIPQDMMILDIGPRTQELYAQIIATAQTVFWNGPMGVCEKPLFAEGSRVVAKAVADNSGYAVVGGGDTETCVDAFGLRDYFSHVSTGGGASLEYLANAPMPGLIALD